MLDVRRLCDVSIKLDPGAPLSLGKSPWRNRRVSYIEGGTIGGERLRGAVEAGGGDWSELGLNADGDALTLIDVRSVWRTDDDALLYVTYQGRLRIPAETLSSFREPELVEALDPAAYYFRIAPVFETADPRYEWLNGIVAVGLGRRTAVGVDYSIFEVA